MAYAEACVALHGPDFEWDKEPIDGVAAYKAGHGKKHGRYLVGDGMISTPTVLREVRVSSTAGEPTDQHHHHNNNDVDLILKKRSKLSSTCMKRWSDGGSRSMR